MSALTLEEFKALLGEMSFPTEGVTDDSTLTAEIGLDSLALMELALRLTETSGLEISDEEIPGLGEMTVAQVREMMEPAGPNREL